MKKIKIKLALVALAIITMGTALAGCGSKGNTSSAAATDASKLAPYEISWYYVGGSEQKDTAVVEAAINKIIQPKMNATIKLHLLDWGTYGNKIKTMISAGEPFDICFTALWMNDYVKNSQDGAFVALDDYFKKELAGTKKLLGDDFLSGSVINGKNYGIPANKEKARDWGFVYNKTMADKYGFDMSKVKTYADLEPMLKVIKEKEPADVEPLESQKLGGTCFIPWNPENTMNDGEATAILTDGKVVNAFETPEVKAAFDLERKWYNAGYYRKDVLTATDNAAIEKAGKFFAYAMNLKPGYADERNSTLEGYKVAQIDLTDVVMTNADTMGSLQAISKTSKDPQRAAMFLELVNTDKTISNLVNYGVEGTHYTKNANGMIDTVKNSAYAPNMQWMFGNQFITYQYSNEDPKKWENFESFNKKAAKEVSLGFIFDKDPVANELAAIASIVKEYNPALTVGAVDPEAKLPELNKKLKQAGIDKVIKEKQKQYDAWKANKK